MKKRGLLLSLTVLFALIGCAENSSSTSQSLNSNDPSIATSSTSSSSSSSFSDSTPPVLEEYAIKVTEISGVKITPDKLKAKAGDNVNLTVECEKGFSIISLLVNTSEASKVSDTQYTFIMPNRSVVISAKVAVEGDVTVQGDAASSFTKEGNIYVARNVKFASGQGNFNVQIKTDSGVKTLAFNEIDRTKTFANIDPATSYTGKLALGASYDFYYDVSNGVRPLYIKRVSVDVLPNSVNSLYDLFYGRVQSNAAVFPDNLTNVTYSNSEDDVNYTYALDKSGTKSLETFTRKSDGVSLGEKYKSLDSENNLFKWVDTTISYKGNKGKSGKSLVTNYIVRANGVSSELNSDQEFNSDRQYINPLVAPFEVSKNQTFNMYDLEFKFMEAYRVGMTVEDYVKSSSIDISSTKEEDGFKTNIVSSKTYDNTSSTDSSIVPNKTHYEYRVELAFTKEGALKSINYVQKKFDSTLYDFNGDRFISGDATSNFEQGTSAKELNVTYTYKQENTVNFDEDKYFVSSIEKATIKNADATSEDKSVLNSGDHLELENSYLTLDVLPATALDTWQYGVTSSTDTSVVRWDETYNRFAADKTGKSDLTVSNYSDKKVSKVVSVEVLYNIVLRSFYMLYYYNSTLVNVDPDDFTANSITLSSNTISTIGLAASGEKPIGQVALPPDLTFDLSNKDLGLVVSYNATNGTISYDTRNVNVTTATKLTVTLKSSYYASSYTPTSFTVTIKPVSFSSESDIIGRWTNASNVFNVLDEKITLDKKEYFQANLVVGAKTFKTIFTVDLTTGKFTYTYVLNAENKIDDTYTFKIVSNADGQLGLFLMSSSWSGEDSVESNYILGESDENADFETLTYVYFTKA